MEDIKYIHITKGTLSVEKSMDNKTDGVASVLEVIGWLVIVMGIVAGVLLIIQNEGDSTGISILTGCVISLSGLIILALSRIVEHLSKIANAKYVCKLDGINMVIDNDPGIMIEENVVEDSISAECPVCKKTVTLKNGFCPDCSFNVAAYLKRLENK